MNKIKKIILAISFLTVVLVISGCGCKPANTHKYDLDLEIWGPLDQETAMREIFDNYSLINPNVSKITYKKIPIDTYRKELMDALASGQGPDIFMVNNLWLPSFTDKIAPAPSEVDPRIINEQKFRNNFIDVVAEDFIKENKIYAVPLSVDSLALFYNKDLLNQAGIATPPKNWNEFIDDVIKLKSVDSFGNIIHSGAAIGTAYNINRSTDILNLIMLQNGTEMTDDMGRVAFDDSFSKTDSNPNGVYLGEEALNFYTQFANSKSFNYTWNPNMHYSIDAFSEGLTAMMINYSWNVDTILAKSPKLNFAVSPVPQFENKAPVNFANYWGFVVAKNSISKTLQSTVTISNDTRVKEAWWFLTYLSTKPDGTFAGTSSGSGVGQSANLKLDPAVKFLAKTGQPAARRDLIELQKTDPKVGVFAAGNLIAKSWRQKDSTSVESIFAEMIDSVNKGQATVSDALKTAAQRVNNL
ncbi:MAG TPA: extracellular solute-binding protein [Candidatus Moranbacteria bacterium]|nr:extracellular solute-binding protein [Candidatus Moranbacteria bacterium]